jgi:FixJ family two-component response regulator
VGSSLKIQAFAERSQALKVSNDEFTTAARCYEKLTPRKRQIFALIVDGSLNKQAASDLGIAEKTVKVHRARVMAKMRAGSLAELARIAERLGVRSADILKISSFAAVQPEPELTYVHGRAAGAKRT